MSAIVEGTPTSPAEMGRKLFLRSVSSSVDETLSRKGVEEEEEESVSEGEADLDELEIRKRRTRRRSSLAGAKIGSQIPSRTIVDSRFVVNPGFQLPCFDLQCYRVNKDLYFLHQQTETSPLRVMFRISKLAKGLLGSSTWQIYAGSSEPLAVIKQVARTINPTFYIFRGTDAKKGEVVYSLKKKTRSSKVRVYNGEGCKETALLKYFSLIGDDRMYIKMKDASAIGGEALGETIVDWRAQTSLLRIGKGFDTVLAVVCFCLADVFEPHSLEVPSEVRESVMQAIRSADGENTQDWRQICGW